MNLVTSEAELTKELAEGFWASFSACVTEWTEGGIFKTFRTFEGELHPSLSDKTPPFTLKLLEESLRRVRVELGDKAALSVGKPTEFVRLFFESLLVHSADVKREMIPREMPDYDIEADIVATTAEARTRFEEMFRTELVFLKSFEDGRLDDSDIHLRSLEVMRAGETGPRLVEVLSWRIDLSVRKGDVSAFLAAFGRIPDEGLLPVSALRNGLTNLIATAWVNGLGVAPSLYGIMTVQMPAGLQPFVDAMFGIWMEAVADRLCKARQMTESDFRKMIVEEFEHRRRTFLLVTPQIGDIIIQWR